MPVTVFCGFLGAGKTTLLNHLLKQAEGHRWAAIVNDLAAVNVDAAVVQEGLEAGGNVSVVELSNGCVCCSSRDELGETTARLAMGGSYEHLLIETTGVALPRGIAQLFLQPNPFGRPLSQVAKLATLVSVIDAAHFLREWNAYRSVPPSRALAPALDRPVIELMIEQVEASDLLVINKVDLVSEDDLLALESIVASLNPRAELVRAEHGQVSSELVLGRSRFEPLASLASAQWIRALNTVSRAVPVPPGGSLVLRPESSPETAEHTGRYGISSWVYQARRPFSKVRFESWLHREAPGLLRAKGFFWFEERPDEMGFLSLAGTGVQLDFVAYWWAARYENGKIARDQLPAEVLKLWNEPFGDRRQELVFIGVGLDEAGLKAGLDECLQQERS